MYLQYICKIPCWFIVNEACPGQNMKNVKHTHTHKTNIYIYISLARGCFTFSSQNWESNFDLHRSLGPLLHHLHSLRRPVAWGTRVKEAPLRRFVGVLAFSQFKDQWWRAMRRKKWFWPGALGEKSKSRSRNHEEEIQLPHRSLLTFIPSHNIMV